MYSKTSWGPYKHIWGQLNSPNVHKPDGRWVVGVAISERRAPPEQEKNAHGIDYVVSNVASPELEYCQDKHTHKYGVWSSTYNVSHSA